jgi:outer membrane immunogenic protein
MDADFGFTDDTFELEVDVMGSLRAKAGYAVENFLLYATGGLAVASSTYEDSNGGPSESFDTTAFGFTVGAGAEIAFSETLSGRLEYRYTDLGQETFDSAIFDPSVILKANYEFHAVRAGLSWHF